MKIEAFHSASLGKVKILLDQVDSTQVFAAQLLRDSLVVHGTLIMARSQTEGQGRMGKTWVSNPADNFTGSLILKHRWKFPPPVFMLSQVTALAVRNLVESVSGYPTQIKWPNDILVDHRKVAGILITNQWKGQIWESSIVGIGINVNQIVFDPGLTHAISLTNLTGKSIDMNEVIQGLMSYLSEYYLILTTGIVDRISMEYMHFLYGAGDPVTVRILETNRMQQARIEEVAPSGEIRLKMETGESRLFDLDQISIQLP